ncbi:hypothetical protein CPLU01_14170 [Colletotrichum plurivorum]|uniref:DUF6594 domain-containing protein n=1 Tax=Colletotrichum plurivorum TaxID=2175906 RepID=A0A8H6JLJ0_9PEZI|nr:hypothetical protein CPLU01_14170 [Colletotrichum plurivorum]
MATGSTPAAALTSPTAAAAAPTTEGQVSPTASVHSNPKTTPEEGQAATTQAPQEVRRGRSRDRARNTGRHIFQEVKIENAQPAEHVLTPGQPDYFQSLVASALNTRTLPIVKTSPFRQIETAPLYPFAPAQVRVTSQDLGGEHGTALALELAINTQTSHVAAKLRSQMIRVADDGNTSDTDLKRMRGLLFQLNTGSTLAICFLGAWPTGIYRVDSSLLFRFSVALGNNRAVTMSTMIATVAKVEESTSSLDASLSFGTCLAACRSRDANARYDLRGNRVNSNAKDPSALEEGQPAAPEGERDEEAEERGSLAKFIEAVAAVLVLIVCFIPGLIYLGVRLLLPNSENNPRRRFNISTEERYNKQFRGLEYARKTGFPQRLGAALVGGLSLITPMLIMSLDPSHKKSLITTSVFILVFGFVLAWRTSMQAGEVLTATATYAAVLVVFTGVSN